MTPITNKLLLYGVYTHLCLERPSVEVKVVEDGEMVIINGKTIKVAQSHYDSTTESMSLVNIPDGCDYIMFFLYNKDGINTVMFETKEITPYSKRGEVVFGFDNMVPIAQILPLVKYKFTLIRSHAT